MTAEIKRKVPQLVQQGEDPELGGMLLGLAKRLERYAIRFERLGDSRCVFTRLYSLLTRALARELEDGQWRDPRWVAALAQTFSQHYFAALDAFDAGLGPSVAWDHLQTTMRQKRSSVFQDSVAGMVGHIVHDLPFALGQVGLAVEKGDSHIADYQHVNDVLGGAIEPLRADVERHYNPWLRWLDFIGRKNEDVITNFGIRLSRAAAWYNACRLLDPASAAATRASLERSPVALVKSRSLCNLTFA
jgi:hypothetical protein